MADDLASNKRGSYGLAENVENYTAFQNGVIEEKITVTSNEEDEVLLEKIMNVCTGSVNLEAMVDKSLGGAEHNSKGKDVGGCFSDGS